MSIGLALMLMAAEPAAVVAPLPVLPPNASVQQRFEYGYRAIHSGQAEAGLKVFEDMEKRLLADAKPSQANLAVVRVAKGQALLKLGRFEQAAEALTQGLAGLDPKGAQRGAWVDGMASLAQMQEADLDYASAYQLYRKVIENVPADDAASLVALVGKVRTGLFVDPVEAVADADTAYRRYLALPDTKKDRLADVRSLKARALLNSGRFDEAYTELLVGLKEAGGLGKRVNLTDIGVRSDLALAALLSGKSEIARRYLTWTGAGHLEGEGFKFGTQMQPPPCRGPADIRPDDVAVIQFSIGENGAVSNVQPIYASRPGPMALEFAQAVRNWSWTPAAAQAIKPFFRYMTRLEMRCSMAVNRPSVVQVLEPDVAQWYEREKISFPEIDTSSDARALPRILVEIARLGQSGETTSSELIPFLHLAVVNGVIGRDEAIAYGRRLLAAVRDRKAPAPVQAYYAIIQARLESRDGDPRGYLGRVGRALEALLSDPVISGDARSRAAVALELAEGLAEQKKFHKAQVALDRIVTDKGLSSKDPLRVAALVQTASFVFADGHADAARSAYAQTGLSAQQCALVDIDPIPVRRGATTSDYPADAWRWGFEGWVTSEFDIDAKGDTRNVRTLIAYPPFVFGRAATTIIDRSSYRQTYRPEGGLGCGGHRDRVVFSHR